MLFLQGYRHTNDLPRLTAWYFDRTRSGDNIVEQACHIIDLMVWAAGSHPLRAFGSDGVNLFKDKPAGRTTMDSHIYFDPPGFFRNKERVYSSDGAIDLATDLPFLAAFIDKARGKKKPLNHADSARISTMTAMMGRKSIYEQRVVTWEEVDV